MKGSCFCALTDTAALGHPQPSPSPVDFEVAAVVGPVRDFPGAAWVRGICLGARAVLGPAEVMRRKGDSVMQAQRPSVSGTP